MNFFQKVSITSTEILAESEYRFCQISRRKSIFLQKACVQNECSARGEFSVKIVFIEYLQDLYLDLP
jgi:hypothetical protein